MLGVLMMVVALGAGAAGCASNKGEGMATLADVKALKEEMKKMKGSQTDMANLAEVEALKEEISKLKDLSSCAGPIWTALSSGCYLFDATPRTWNETYQFCNNWLSKMVEVDSKKENDALVQEITRRGWNSQKVRPWIGLSDQESEGNFKWTTGEEPTYTNWLANQPDNDANGGNEDCVHYWPSQWNDAQCGRKELPHGDKLVALCEKS